MTHHDRDVFATLLESTAHAMLKAADQLREHHPEIEQPTAPPPPPVPDWMDTAELADWLHLKPQTIRKWRVVGGGPLYTRLGAYPGGRIIYKRTDIEEWLKGRKKPHTAAEIVEQQQRRP